MNIEITEYTSDYFPQIYQILNKIYDSKINITDLENNYLGLNKKIYLAIFDNTVVGCAFLEIRKDYIRSYQYGFISYVAVDQQYRKQGIGKQLIEHLFLIAKKDKCQAVELTSANFRTTAHSFYKSLNFSKKDTTIFIKEPL